MSKCEPMAGEWVATKDNRPLRAGIYAVSDGDDVRFLHHEGGTWYSPQMPSDGYGLYSVRAPTFWLDLEPPMHQEAAKPSVFHSTQHVEGETNVKV